MKNIKLIKHNTLYYYEECVEHYYVGSIPHVVETYHNRDIVYTNNTTIFYGRFIKRGVAYGFNIKKTNKYNNGPAEYNIQEFTFITH